MPATLPAGSLSLPPLGGRLLAAYRMLWWLLLALALAAIAQSWIEPSSGTIILGLRLSKSIPQQRIVHPAAVEPRVRVTQAPEGDAGDDVAMS